MLWALLASLAVALSHGPLPAKYQGTKAPVLVRTAQQLPQDDAFDAAAEQELYVRVNHDRARAGLPPFEWDEGLQQAAREHAQAMAEQGELSHQVAGEAALAERIGSSTSLRLDRTGENVALAPDAERAEASLMQSAGHRANLLDAGFNVAGFAALRTGDGMYVVQDFGRRLPDYSAARAEQMVTAAVQELREPLRPLEVQSLPELRSAACDMARRDRLDGRGSPVIRGARFVLSFTNPRPQNLPRDASRAVNDPAVQRVAVGACFERSPSYPTGTFWVQVVFY